jgi:hypothetical protein
VDPEIHQIIQQRFTDTSGKTQKQFTDKKNWLLKINTDIIAMENFVINYCNLKCQSTVKEYNSLEILVGQSSTILSPRETLTISAGMGEYSRRAQSKIKINGLNIEAYNGMGVANIIVPKKPGEYKIPVEIEYIKQDGTSETKTVEIQYRVVE